jgi:hypothetical protein
VSDAAIATRKDTNGSLALVFAATSLLILGPIGAVLAVVFAARSRRALGYRSTAARVALIVGWIIIALSVVVIGGLFVLALLIQHSNLTY